MTAPRELNIPEDFTPDPILSMLVDELSGWLRTAEATEAALQTLSPAPDDLELREKFDVAQEKLSKFPLDWIEINAPLKAPDTDYAGQMKQIRKLFLQADFLMMPDAKLTPEQAMGAIRAKLKSQGQRIGPLLDTFAEAIRQLAG